MKHNRNFVYITTADFIARSAYQMGKTPLLPIFAAVLGAGSVYLGLIVSVSTLTGMILKPFIGIFSDRWGRRSWLIIGTTFFAVMPFFYRFVHSPEQLLMIRLVHGLATAIYGPVTLAFVAERAKDKRAERLGIFGMARSAGFMVGPATAGWLLLYMDPVAVFTMIGLLSSLVFIPVLRLPESAATTRTNQRLPLRRQFSQAFRSGSQTPAVWFSGGLEATMFIALYAVRAFLPIYALSLGVSVVMVGLFFSLQQAMHMVLKPVGGRLGDRMGYLWTICLGMTVLGLTLPLLTLAQGSLSLIILSLFLGAGEALISPSTVALVSAQIDERHLGAGMGLIGTLSNAGKVLGPILGGALIFWLDYTLMFWSMGFLVLVSGVVIWYWALVAKKIKHKALTASV